MNAFNDDNASYEFGPGLDWHRLRFMSGVMPAGISYLNNNGWVAPAGGGTSPQAQVGSADVKTVSKATSDGRISRQERTLFEKGALDGAVTSEADRLRRALQGASTSMVSRLASTPKIEDIQREIDETRASLSKLSPYAAGYHGLAVKLADAENRLRNRKDDESKVVSIIRNKQQLAATLTAELIGLRSSTPSRKARTDADLARIGQIKEERKALRKSIGQDVKALSVVNRTSLGFNAAGVRTPNGGNNNTPSEQGSSSNATNNNTPSELRGAGSGPDNNTPSELRGTDSSSSGDATQVDGAADDAGSSPHDGLRSTYTVQAGDSLWLIAQRYSKSFDTTISWQDIYDANRSQIASPGLIYVGQQFEIPGIGELINQEIEFLADQAEQRRRAHGVDPSQIA